MRDADSPGLTSTVSGVVIEQNTVATAAAMHDPKSPDSTHTVMGVLPGQESLNTTTAAQDKDLSDSTGAAIVAMSDQGQKNVSIQGGIVFESLFEVKDTPPGSPGSAASSSTLVDPQSRRVSPTTIKDFAYPPSDDNHVLDPVAIIEENTKKQLLKQLQKMTAAEEKASRQVLTLSARNEALCAELRSVKPNLPGNSQLQLAITREKAVTLSNIVLRQLVQDLCNELSRAKNVVEAQGTEFQGEIGFFEKYGVDPVVLSRLVGSDEFDSATLQNSRQPRTDEASSTDDDTEEENVGIENRVAQEAADQDGMSESSGEEQEFEVDDETSPPICEEPISTSDGDEETAAQEPAMEVQDHVQDVGSSHGYFVDQSFEFSEPAGPATLWSILQSNQVENEAEDTTDADEEVAGTSEVPGPAKLPSSQYEDELEEQPVAGEEAADEKPTTEPILSRDDDQDVGDSHGYFVNQNFESSGAAGPVNLWGILESDHKSSEGGFSDEEFGEQAQVEGNQIPNESESNGVAGVQDQEDREFVGLPDNACSPEFNGEFDELYDVSDDEEEGMEVPTTSTDSAIEEPAAPSPHGSVDGDNVAVQEVVQEVTVEETVDIVGPGAPEISVEAVIEPVCGAEVVGGEEDEARNGTVQAAELQGPVDTVGTTTMVVMDDVFESLEDATVAEGAASGEEISISAPEANASEVHVVDAQPARPPLPSRALPSYHVETFDDIPPMAQPKELTKRQKRNIGRKRAAAEKKEEAAINRLLEEEAAKTPEALAQRQAEADTTLGERRLKLQAARRQEAERMQELLDEGFFAS